jgi:hypothetical protein
MITMVISVEIHRGDSTQIHGQVMWPVSFNPIKRTVSNPENPIPEEEDDDPVVCLLLER